MSIANNRRIRLLILGTLVLLAGCDSTDERLQALSRESLDRQADQNRAMSQQNQTVAEEPRDLVAADAEARRDILETTRAIQTERANLDRQHEHLAEERRQVVELRQREPVIAHAIS